MGANSVWPGHNVLSALRNVLSDYGLDISRYAPTLVELFLRQWGQAVLECRAEARAALVGAFSIGETTFLRHPEQFRALRTLLPQIAEDGNRLPLRVFSAGCATGEEAYSLASVLAVLGTAAYEVEAWDFNPRAIDRAKEGVYRPWSLRDVDSADVQDWLDPAPCGVAVREELKARVRFRVANLNADELPQQLDIIFCRNVLLYFRRDLAARVIERLVHSLRVGGVLFLGHYDPPPEGTLPLVERHIDGVRYFVRTVCARPVQATPSLPPPDAAQPILLAQRAPAPPALPQREMLHVARSLSDERCFDDALQVLMQLRDSRPLDPRAHVLTALVAEEAGRHELMLEAARNAVCLEPDEPATNFFVSVAFRRNGELRRSSIHRRIARARLSPEYYRRRAVPFGEGLTARQLERMIRGRQF